MTVTKKEMSEIKVKKERPQTRHLIPAKKGEVRNPNGRPKGTRNRFSEAFCADLLREWESGGPECMKRVMHEDPSTFLRVAASVLPKELNVNEGETALDRILESYNDTELVEIFAGIRALGVRKTI